LLCKRDGIDTLFLLANRCSELTDIYLPTANMKSASIFFMVNNVILEEVEDE